MFGEIGVIFSFQDDGVLYVYQTIDDLVRAVEPLDADETLQMTFDDTGQRYVIEWLRPNTYSRKFLGMFGTALNGEYRLVPRGNPDPHGLRDRIENAVAIEPNEQRSSVSEVKDRLTVRST